MKFRHATLKDCALLAELNHQLIRDEGHRNRMTVPKLQQRMKGWLASEYTAVLFENSGEIVAYALYRELSATSFRRAAPAQKRPWPGSRQNSARKSLAEKQAADR